MRTVTIEELYAWAMERKLWLLVKSPFMAGLDAKRVGPFDDAWWVGFTPSGISGRNGRPDYYGTGPTFQEAASVALELWFRFSATGLPPVDCHSREDLARYPKVAP